MKDKNRNRSVEIKADKKAPAQMDRSFLFL
jgi:hypothetical protein